MHWNPMAAWQQSALTVHFSYSFAHPWGGTQESCAPASALVWRQYPLQHWSPLMQLAPFCAHGSSAQKPR
jgi:hypothetical protein